jgi:hypothetical protein
VFAEEAVTSIVPNLQVAPAGAWNSPRRSTVVAELALSAKTKGGSTASTTMGLWNVNATPVVLKSSAGKNL